MKLRYSLTVLLASVTLAFGAAYEEGLTGADTNNHKAIVSTFSISDIDALQKFSEGFKVNVEGYDDNLFSQTVAILSCSRRAQLEDKIDINKRLLTKSSTHLLAALLNELFATSSKRIYKHPQKALIMDILTHPELYMIDAPEEENLRKIEERVGKFDLTVFPMIESAVKAYQQDLDNDKDFHNAWYFSMIPDIEHRIDEDALLERYKKIYAWGISSKPLSAEEKKQAVKTQLSRIQTANQIATTKKLIERYLMLPKRVSILRDALSKRPNLTTEQSALLTLDLLKALGG